MHSDVLRGLQVIADGENVLGRGFYEQVKSAAIFGANIPASVISPHPGIDNTQRLRDYEKFLRAKATERPTGYLLPGAIGAGLGGLIGRAVATMPKHNIPFTVGGALVGGLSGLTMAGMDENAIQYARKTLNAAKKDPDALSQSLSGALAKDFENQRQRERNRDFNTTLLLLK
jgi:hypothetical protein